MVQIIRYLDSPAGPYDEMLVTPGKFEYEVEEGGKKIKKRNTRVTRIYVSQKVTCYNGRLREYLQFLRRHITHAAARLEHPQASRAVLLHCPPFRCYQDRSIPTRLDE